MKRVLRVACALAICLVAAQAQAVLDKAKWGMRLDEIKKLYPSGEVAKIDDDRTVYRLVRPVGVDSRALVSFFLSQGCGLDSVELSLIPPQGTFNLLTGAVSGMTISQSRKAGIEMRRGLSDKYGVESPSSYSSGTYTFAWVAGESESVYLYVEDGSESDNAARVVYSPKANPCKLHRADGL